MAMVDAFLLLLDDLKMKDMPFEYRFDIFVNKEHSCYIIIA